MKRNFSYSPDCSHTYAELCFLEGIKHQGRIFIYSSKAFSQAILSSEVFFLSFPQYHFFPVFLLVLCFCFFSCPYFSVAFFCSFFFFFSYLFQKHINPITTQPQLTGLFVWIGGPMVSTIRSCEVIYRVLGRHHKYKH